jgi:DNA primase
VALRFDHSTINRIQQSVDIVDIVSEHLSLKRKGKEFVGLCPFHQDNRPSLNVSPSKQIFKCFACGAGGDVFKFIQLRENLTFPEAVERLANRAGIELQPVKRHKAGNGSNGSDGYSDKARQSDIARVNAWALKFFRKCFEHPQGGAVAREYLQGRQINEQSQQDWQIGYAPDEWTALTDAALKNGIKDKLLVEAGLAVQRDDGSCFDKFRNRLMFPIFDVTGRVIGFGGRTLGDDPAKYMNSPATVLFDKSNCIFGLERARHEIVSSSVAVVVEGYTDVIMAHQFGCDNVCATLGTSFTAGHARLLRRYAKKVVLVFDSDLAGNEAANRAVEVCLGQKIDIKLAFVPAGKDPCDYLLEAGKEALENVIDQATDVLDYKWQRLKDTLSRSDNLTDSRSAAEEYLRTIAVGLKAGAIDSVTTGLIINKIAGLLAMDPAEVKSRLRRLSSHSAASEHYTVENRTVVSLDWGQGLYARTQRELLEILLAEPGYFQNIKNEITVEHFNVPILRHIADALFGLLNENSGDFKLASLLSRVDQVEVSSAIIELSQYGSLKGNFEKRLQDCLEVVKECRLKMIHQTSGSEFDNETEKLRKINEMVNKNNKRNPGMTTR